MIVVHIESGLGNQMLSYCELLALKKSNPGEKIYIENLVYSFEESDSFISQWNGYELDRIFGIREPNIRDIISDEKWETLLDLVSRSEFWNHCWNWPVLFTKAFNQIGIKLTNIRGDFESKEIIAANLTDDKNLKYLFKHSRFYLLSKNIYVRLRKNELINSLNYEKELFLVTDEDVLTGQRLSFKYHNSGIERIADDIRRIFVFPEVEDEKNRTALAYIQSVNSVAIHARRGDMLSTNGYCYKNGYFKRAISFIKKNVENPEFFFFCDPGSIDWCKTNGGVFSLDFSRDKVHFIDWNKGENSFRDMQLMSSCKHNVITTSSFGWWGAWLNTNPDKITCSPDYHINTTHTF